MPLNNSQYNEIMREYSRRRAAHHSECEARLRRIYAKHPDIEQAGRKIQRASAELAKARALGLPEAECQALRQRLTSLQADKEELLTLAGLSEKDLEPEYTCQDCRDTGFIGLEKCHCMKQMEIDLLYTQSNLKKILETENFSTFSLKYYSHEINRQIGKSNYDYMKELASSCLRYAREFRPGSPNLLFTGNVGVGKTFLSHCIAAEVLSGGHSVMGISAIDLFDRLAARSRSFSEDEIPETDYLLDCDLLLIDDLGSENTTSNRISQLFYCLNTRLLNSRSTIISTNIPVNELRTVYTERISSRILSYYTYYPLYGVDIRFMKNLRE